MRSAASQWRCVFLAGAAAVLSACGNAEKSAAKAVEKASADWASAREDLDPEKRVKAYDGVIKNVEAVGKKYKKTAYGQAIANGGSAGGISIAAMKAERDSLATRAGCYSNPTTACLKPFASRAYQESAALGAAGEDPLAEAQRLVCEKNFAAADKALDQFKINKPAYAQQLVQVGLAASACDKPEAVKDSVAAYLAAEPAQGANRAQALMSIAATPDLEAGWAPVLGELETMVASGDVDPNTAANVTLTLATSYAALGDSKAALAKYAYFTETLNYQADWQSRLSLAASLIAGGDPESGMKIVDTNGQKSFFVIALHEAAADVAKRVGVLPTNTGVPMPQLYNVKSIDDLMAPVEGAEKGKVAASIATVESEIDKLAQTVVVQDSAIGMSGLDCTYGIVALVHQKLGASDRASAAMGKGVALRQKLLGAGAENVGIEYFAQFQTLLALAQGKPAEAATFSQAINNRNDTTRLIVRSLAAKGDAEGALTLASQLGQGGDNRAAYQHIIEGLIEGGHIEKAEEVIAAFPGDAGTKNGFTWLLVNAAANEGNVKKAQEIADKNGLLSGPSDRYRLLTVSLNNEKVARDRKKAEPIIREVFTLGEEIDKNGSGNSSYDGYYAQNAAEFAFRGGYNDLGVELYRAATKKDQRPLFSAFNDEMKPREMTPIFMLAQDNLSGEELGYVIDAGIRKLERAGS